MLYNSSTVRNVFCRHCLAKAPAESAISCQPLSREVIIISVLMLVTEGYSVLDSCSHTTAWPEEQTTPPPATRLWSSCSRWCSSCRHKPRSSSRSGGSCPCDFNHAPICCHPQLICCLDSPSSAHWTVVPFTRATAQRLNYNTPIHTRHSIRILSTYVPPVCRASATTNKILAAGHTLLQQLLLLVNRISHACSSIATAVQHYLAAQQAAQQAALLHATLSSGRLLMLLAMAVLAVWNVRSAHSMQCMRSPASAWSAAVSTVGTWVLGTGSQQHKTVGMFAAMAAPARSGRCILAFAGAQERRCSAVWC